jgi:hypothetical protein
LLTVWKLKATVGRQLLCAFVGGTWPVAIRDLVLLAASAGGSVDIERARQQNLAMLYQMK